MTTSSKGIFVIEKEVLPVISLERNRLKRHQYILGNWLFLMATLSLNSPFNNSIDIFAKVYKGDYSLTLSPTIMFAKGSQNDIVNVGEWDRFG